ncbi:hypothetical protein AF332_22315 [Sporosarcina globispora]|uniref:Uncharacterized protein n=1 Tax=Sporosarcina globispora TaxID=1459 RepID=A0A0M0GHE9_SPOGL|nr:hypothetical protein AF332_22315 [Sporosarcina globispora]
MNSKRRKKPAVVQWKGRFGQGAREKAYFCPKTRQVRTGSLRVSLLLSKEEAAKSLRQGVQELTYYCRAPCISINRKCY